MNYPNADRVDIIYATDNKFAAYTSVAAISTLLNTAVPVRFHIIGNLSEDIKWNLSRIAELKPCEINFIPFDEALLRSYKNIKVRVHLNLITYCRLLAPLLLPDLDKAVYLDSDTLTVGDLAPLYHTDIGDSLYAGSDDMLSARFKQKLNIPDQHPYINCGVLLINLRALRAFDALGQMSTFAETYPEKIETADQDVINGCFYDRTRLVSCKYNLYAEHNSQYIKNFTPNDPDDFNHARKHPVVIHFVGSQKPWHIVTNAKFRHKYTYKFWHYARMSPFYERILCDNLPAVTSVLGFNVTALRDAVNYHRNRIAYRRCNLLAAITWGKWRKHYRDKKACLKERLINGKKVLRTNAG